MAEVVKAFDVNGKIVPVVGMGATTGIGSDSYPHTVVWVSEDGKKLEVTDDETKPASGFDYFNNQVYTYITDMTGPRTRFRLRKNGEWVKDKQPMRSGTRLYLGYRRYYQDPSF